MEMNGTEFFTLFGIVFIAMALYKAVILAVVLIFGKKTVAEVSGYDTAHGVNPNRPILFFCDENGKAVHAVYKDSFIHHKMGEKLVIYYLPKDTSKIIPITDISSFIYVPFFILAGIAFLIMPSRLPH